MPQFLSKRIVFLSALLIVFFFQYCNQKKENKTEPERQTVVLHPESGCYQLIIEKDTALMNLKITGDSVSGNLAYKRFEKDSNDGTFKGTMLKDTLDAWYHFQSEGVLSVRQIKMLFTENGFSEGYGDVQTKGDTVYFQYPQALNFERNHLYQKIVCP